MKRIANPKALLTALILGIGVVVAYFAMNKPSTEPAEPPSAIVEAPPVSSNKEAPAELPPVASSTETSTAVITLQSDKKLFEIKDHDESSSLPHFTWSTSLQSNEWTVEVASDQEFRRLFATESVAGTSWTWKKPFIGQFYVRVKSQTSVSNMTVFTTIITAPVLESVVLNTNKSHLIHVQWSHHGRASAGEIQVSKSKDFQNSVSYKATGVKSSVEVPGSGLFYVRVRYLSYNGWAVSRFSKFESVEIPIENLADDEKTPTENSTAAIIEDVEHSHADLGDKYLLQSKGGVYLGAGLDYLSFKQEGATGNDSGSFAKPVMPTLLLGIQYQLAENSRLLFEYQSWSGDIDASDVGPITGTHYNWTSLFGEYQHRVYQTPHSSYSLLLGVQQHEIPFLSGNALSQIDILQNKLLTGSLGVQGKFLSESRKYEAEVELRYQHLLSSESLDGYKFKASSPFMFEGSIGVSRYFDHGFKAGIHWLGQQQNFNYEFTRDGTESTGKQTLFNSNIQIRFGWEFLSLLTVSSVPISVGLRRRFRKVKSDKKK